MDRMLPVETAEPIVRGSGTATALRGTVYGLLGLAVACGAWLRVNSQAGGLLPQLAAGGGAAEAGQVHVRPLLEVALVPAGEAEAAVAGLALPDNEAAQLRAALRDRRLRLVRLPLVDTSGVPAGHDLSLRTSGYSRTLRLTGTPVVVDLPMAAGGEIAFATPDPQAVGIETMGLTGPIRLPDLARGDVLRVGVVAQ